VRRIHYIAPLEAKPIYHATAPDFVKTKIERFIVDLIPAVIPALGGMTKRVLTHWIEITCIKASDKEKVNFVVSFVLSLVGGIFSFDKARDKEVLIFVLIFVLNFDFTFILYEIDS
jgi:hypothetical protein